MLYSYKQQFPTELPDRIRLSNGLTRTDKNTFTEEEIFDAGYVAAPDAPAIDPFLQRVEWDGHSWIIKDLSEQEINEAKWKEVREIRDGTIQNNVWRVERALSEQRLGLPTTDNLQQLDEFMQALRDITKQEDPFNIIWPQDLNNTVSGI